MPPRLLVGFVLLFTLPLSVGAALDSPDHSTHLRPPLGAILDRYEEGVDLRTAAGSPLGEHMADGRIPCFVRLQEASIDPSTLGIDAQTRAGAICTARLLPEEIRRLATHPDVTHISMATLVHPLLDVSVPEINADQVHDSDGGIPPIYSGHTGQDVILGIIDSGIDHQHPDFWDGGSTRILSVWDQTVGGTPPPGFGYGNECDQDDIETATCTEMDTDGHGSHMAGIAAGNGAATDNGEPSYQFIGTAPEGDIISVKTSFFTVDIADGVSYIFGKAASLGKPAVVVLGVGNQYGPHDGTGDLDIFLSNLVGEGKVIVAAAGNEKGDAIHAEAVVTQGSTEIVTFEIPAYSPQPGGVNDIVDMDGWYTGGSQLSLTLTSPNGHFVGPVTYGNSMTLATPDGEITIDNATWNPPNGDENFHIEVIDVNASEPPADGVWQLDVHGTSVPTGLDALASEADMWFYFWSLGGVAPTFVMGVEEAEIVASPASADSVIAVGCYVTKGQWLSIDGNNYQYIPPVTLGEIARFSSIGPRRDGWLKPDITAPGMGIFSTLSADATINPIFINPDGVHYLNQGTSMASPHIAGVVALMFNSLGNMYTGEVMARLSTTARSDEFTGPTPNDTWGWGKVDALAATQSGEPDFRIVSITDVGNDQGRQVRLKWRKHPDDPLGDGTPNVTDYNIFRRIDEFLLPESPSGDVPGSEELTPPGEWDFIKTVPALGDSIYNTICPTLCDSTIANGECWSVFFVKAETDSPGVFYETQPDSGQSVDNLSPAPPANLHWESTDVLAWEEAQEEDFNYFSVYGSDDPEFEEAELIGHTIETGMDVSGTDYNYYHATATDFSGNEGDPSTIQAGTSGAPEDIELPTSFALRRIRPNPGRVPVQVAFDMPREASVSLQVFDVAGRRVKILVDGTRPAGRHVLSWRLVDDNGRRLAAGVYWVSFKTAGYAANRKLIVLE